MSLRKPTSGGQLPGRKPTTDFQRACEKLGVEIITAHSPKVKEGVERMNGILQDRWVKDMRFKGENPLIKPIYSFTKSFCLDSTEKGA